MRILEQPTPPLSRAERVIVPEMDDEEEDDDDVFMFTRSTLNLLLEVWNPNKTMLQNLKLIIGFIQSYMIAQGKSDPSAVRVGEARIMKDALVNLLNVWKKKKRRGCSAACSVEELNIFLVEEKLAATLSEDIMFENTFREWSDEFKVYIGRRPTLRVDATTSTTARSSSGADGMNALFSGSSLAEDEIDERLPQYISKVENGRVYTVRTPGEVGHTLIRLDVYEVRDILKKDKRDWWKYAKLRSQILTSSTTDSKYQTMKQLLDLAADDLIGVTGLRKEVSSVAQ